MKGVILAAGYATRFLPASKTIPKEMFPLIDTPVIDYIVSEMVDSGIHDILLVSSRRKKSMEDYFDREVELSHQFTATQKFDKLEVIQPIEANVFMLRQQYMMGTGNALKLVKPFVGDSPFVVAYPDDIVLGQTPLTKQLIEAYQQTGDTILAVQKIEKGNVSRYGVIDPATDGNLMKVRQMVEKPAEGTEPSRFVSYGRYLYTADIFEELESHEQNPHSHSEFTQTEAINILAKQNQVSALQFQGIRYDVGEPLGYIQATLKISLTRDEFRKPMLEYMKKILDEETDLTST